MNDASLRIEVVYALADEQQVISLSVPAGATVREAIERSGILQQWPEIDLARNKVGRWNRVVELDEPVNSGDRIEIYRPLLIDPKASRRARAADARKGR